MEMDVSFRSVTAIQFNGSTLKLKLNRMHQESYQDFWDSMNEIVLDQDPECTAEDMVRISPSAALYLLVNLAEQLNKEETIPLIRVTQIQQDAIDLIHSCVEGNENV